MRGRKSWRKSFIQSLLCSLLVVLLQPSAHGDCPVIQYVNVVKAEVIKCEIPEELVRSWVGEADGDVNESTVQNILRDNASYLNGSVITLVVTESTDAYLSECLSFREDKTSTPLDFKETKQPSKKKTLSCTRMEENALPLKKTLSILQACVVILASCADF
jgi:hypothetical protein